MSNPPPSGMEDLPSTTPRTTSLAATAAMNAGLQRETTNEESASRKGSTDSGQDASPTAAARQQSSISMNLSLNDPAVPAPGELQASSGASEARSTSRTTHSPQVRAQADRSRSSSIATRTHGRQPSVGEVYQEMEQEQEAQVNRLLQTIRHQQQQIAVLEGRSTPDMPSPASERRPSMSFATGPPPLFSPTNPQSPLTIRSRRQSQTSPAPVRSVPTGHHLSQALPHDQENAVLSSGQGTPTLPTPTSSVSGATRDEVAFYQAEAQNLTKENQMLKARIKELERQVISPSALSPTTSHSNAPPIASHLSKETSVDEDVDMGLTKT